MNYIEGSYVYGDDVPVDDYYLDEKWAYIYGFPEYMVSDKGRVWSKKKKKFLKVKPMDNHGHLGVCLSKNGDQYYVYIHRLVAKAFIPNPNCLPVVRHVYDNPSQNAVEDLAWGTQLDNMRDAQRNGTAYILTDDDRDKGNRERMRPLVAIDVSSKKKSYFQSQGKASKELGIPQSNIWQVLNKRRRTAGGYIFQEVLNG